MQTLAIKYRPQSFDEVTEQGSIKSILRNQLTTGTFKNSYLFTGGAGTGKTTCARIFAHDLNEGQGTPIEIDAASNNGVDDVREIISGAKFKSLDSKYKVYIIDECHMLSNGAWNAMLKLIEEPPAQTIFIFCTTDPQKIPNTILSRTQRYDFKRISYEGIVKNLAQIIKAENGEYAGERYIDVEPQAIEYIATIADGGMRDAITLLDKCISYNLKLDLKNVTEALGSVDYSFYYELTESILSFSTLKVLKLINDIYYEGIDLKQMIKLYIKFLVEAYKVCLLGVLNTTTITVNRTYIDAWTANKDYLYFSILLDTMRSLSNDIKWESSPKAIIEATFLSLSEDKTGGSNE